MPRVGAWHADIEVDTGSLDSAVTLDVEGQLFQGTAVRAAPFSGRTRARVVGGGGTLSRTLGPKNYVRGPKVRAIVTDVLGGAEALSPESNAGVLGAELSRWQRIESQASHALVTLLERIGATWRVLSDGTVWIGHETWPQMDPPHALLDEDWYTGVLTVAPEAPTLRPGVTLRGHRIQEVVHTLSRAELRTEAFLTSTSGSLARFLGSIRRAIDYSRKYSARVAAQNSDGTLQVVPDDERLRGSGLDRVKIQTGFPGTIQAEAGSRCLIGFDGGDPSKPYAEGWDGRNVTEMSLADGTLPAGRQGDMVISGGPSTFVIFQGLAAPPNGAVAVGVPYNVLWWTPPNPPVPFLSGVVSSGNPKVKI